MGRPARSSDRRRGRSAGRGFLRRTEFTSRLPDSDDSRNRRPARQARAGQRIIQSPRKPPMDHLDELEAQSIYIFREAFARLKKIALLWSLGKDSNVMIWLARKAFFGRVPFPVMHVDTGKKFPEMYAF